MSSAVLHVQVARSRMKSWPAVCWLSALLFWLVLSPLASATTVQITQAQATTTVSGSTVAGTVTLPYHWDRMQASRSGRATFELAFPMPELTPGQLGQPFGIYFERIGNTAEVRMNGTLLARLGDTAQANSEDFSKSPQYVTVPPQLLMRSNQLRINLRADGGRRGGLARVVVGPESQVLPLYRTAHNCRRHWPWPPSACWWAGLHWCFG
jgi:hypothetical protein